MYQLPTIFALYELNRSVIITKAFKLTRTYGFTIKTILATYSDNSSILNITDYNTRISLFKNISMNPS